MNPKRNGPSENGEMARLQIANERLTAENHLLRGQVDMLQRHYTALQATLAADVAALKADLQRALVDVNPATFKRAMAENLMEFWRERVAEFERDFHSPAPREPLTCPTLLPSKTPP